VQRASFISPFTLPFDVSLLSVIHHRCVLFFPSQAKQVKNRFFSTAFFFNRQIHMLYYFNAIGCNVFSLVAIPYVFTL
jgi:hypothetical protein